MVARTHDVSGPSQHAATLCAGHRGPLFLRPQAALHRRFNHRVRGRMNCGHHSASSGANHVD